jgi:hypothetical protein
MCIRRRLRATRWGRANRGQAAADFLPTLKAALDGTGVQLAVAPVDHG